MSKTAFDEDVHIKCTGQSNKQILENLAYLDSLGKAIEIRIPYVPERLPTKEELQNAEALLNP